MEQERSISVQQKQSAVERLSRNVTVQALTANNFKQASDSLPTKIQATFELPKIWELAQATSENSVRAFIEFELIKLAESINVSGNLTDGQISAIARGIVEDYPNETIADFKICFTKAAKGDYGKIWKLDGIEVGVWVKTYLDQKYEVLEEQLANEKDTYKNQVFQQVRSDADWLQLWKEAIELNPDEKVKTQSTNLTVLNNIRAMTPSEIEKKGQLKPEHHNHPSTRLSELQAHEKHLRYIKANYDTYTGKPLKDVWVKEEIWNENNV